MKADIWMPLHIGDYLSATTDLSTAEHGAYLLLLMSHWKMGDLPDDDVRLARMAKMRLDHWRKIAPAVRAFFGPGEKSGTLRQKRLHVERERALALSEKRAAAARNRWGNEEAATPPQGGHESTSNCLNSQETAHVDACEQNVPGTLPPPPPREDTGSLRSPAAVVAGEQPPTSSEQSGSGSESTHDLFGEIPVPEPDKPTPSALIFSEGLPKLIEMTRRKRESLKGWIGKMRNNGAKDAEILEAIQDAHRRWLDPETELAKPIDWISGAVWARIRSRGNAQREIPEEVSGWKVRDIVSRCGDYMGADCEGAWPGFTAMLADALANGADPDRHIYPACRRAVRKGLPKIESAGWFAFAINGFRTGVAA